MWTALRWHAWHQQILHAGKKAAKRPTDLLPLPWDEAPTTAELTPDRIEAMRQATARATAVAQAAYDAMKRNEN